MSFEFVEKFWKLWVIFISDFENMILDIYVV